VTCARRIARITHVASHVSADDKTVAERIAVAMTIDIETPIFNRAKMASIFEREPSFSHKRPWDDRMKLPKNGTSGKADVQVDSESLGMESTKLNWTLDKTFSKFENVLTGSY